DRGCDRNRRRHDGCEEAVTVVSYEVLPNDLPLVVDAKSLSISGPRDIECSVDATALYEAVRARSVPVKPDDLAGVIDAVGMGAGRRERIVQCGVDATTF